MKSGKAQVLNTDEFKKVISYCDNTPFPERNKAIFYLSFGLGLRVGEIAKLRVLDVLTKDGKIKDTLVLNKNITKNHQSRVCFLEDPLIRQALKDYIKITQCTEYLFLTKHKKPFSANSLQQLLKSIYVNAGFEKASSHTGRRSFATWLDEKGKPINDIRVLMGHSSISTTQIYIDTNPHKLKKAVSNLFGDL